MKYKISIITVCFNAEDDIEKTVISVLSQTFQDFEYIIIDGASKDTTMQIVSKYENKIHQIISESDKGIYDAMNKGIRLANGEWLIFMNAGDYFSSATLLSDIFNRKIPDNVDFLYSDVYIYHKYKWHLCTMSFENGALNHQSVIYRKKLHDRIGYYIVTEKLIISDYLFFIQVPSNSVMKLDQVISFYAGGGVSDHMWARQHALCADVIFKRRGYWNMFFVYLCKIMGDLLPYKIKYSIKKLLFN